MECGLMNLMHICSACEVVAYNVGDPDAGYPKTFMQGDLGR